MPTLAFSRETLHWAASRAAAQSLDVFAQNTAKRESVRQRIRQGLLTLPQAKELAKQARIPFGYLFLPQPPHIEQPSIPDLRQTPQARPLSNDFWDTLEDVSAKQAWLLEYLRENGADDPLGFVGRFANATLAHSAEIAHDICTELGIDGNDRISSANTEGFYRCLADKAERRGILVIKKGFVKTNTKRPLSEKEFRGFALAHPVVPVVFVNAKDAPAAIVFTLMHEIAHIWLGKEGVSGAPVAGHADRQEEVLCNRIAADILLPVEWVQRDWHGPQDIAAIAHKYKVSAQAVALRALHAGWIDAACYEAFIATQAEFTKKPRNKKLGGPNPMKTIPVYNSKRFTRAVVTSTMNGQTPLRDAAALLGTQPHTVVKLAQELLRA